MSIQTITRAAGLETGPNELSTPEGALVKAENVVIRNRDVIEPRPGHTQIPAAYGGPSAKPADEVFFYGSTPIVAYDESTLARFNGTTFNAYSGPYVPPDPLLLRMKAFEAQRNFYFNTTKGVWRLDSVTAIPALAGGPKTMDLAGNLTLAASPGSALQPESIVGYRIVFGLKDANDVVHLGPPSGRAFAKNTGTSTVADVQVQFLVPPWVGTANFYRVYRTANFPLSAEDPGDEMGLVFEDYFTSAQVSAGLVQYTDRTPDNFLSTPLYTNPNSGEGILQANDPPPHCLDMTMWGGRAWYANTKQFQRKILEIVGVGPGANGSTGIRFRDTITIDGLAFVAEVATDSAGNFELVTTGNTYENIRDTARNLVQAINARTSNTAIRAYYLSGPDDPPGKILVESRALDDTPWAVTARGGDLPLTSLVRVLGGTVTATSFYAHGLQTGDTVRLTGSASASFGYSGGVTVTVTVTSSTQFTYSDPTSTTAASYAGSGYEGRRSTPAAGLAWNPYLPASGTTVVSDADARSDRLYYSKVQEPEAVPLLNYVDVGTRGKAILRVVPLRDGLVVFKEEGTYALSGDAPFRVDLLDGTTRLIAPDTAQVASNKVFALTNQGVVAVSESGVQVVSRPIEPELLAYLTPANITTTKVEAFGVSHETDRLYMLWLPALLDSSYSFKYGRAYVFSTLSGAWTTWELPRTCGRVGPDDRLYSGIEGGPYLTRENRTGTQKDYYDETFAASATAWNATTRTLTVTSSAGITPGSIVIQGSNAAVVTGVSGTSVLLSGGSFSAGSVTVGKPYGVRVKWTAFTGAGPAVSKQWRELHFHWRVQDFYKAEVNFSTELTAGAHSKTLQSPSANYSYNPTTLDYTGVPVEQSQVRLFVPQEAARSVYLNVELVVNEAYAYWALNGLSLVSEPTSERTSK